MKAQKESPSQTAGRHVHIGCMPNAVGIPFGTGDLGASLISGPVRGEQLTIKGRVLDGAGKPLLDALVEIWQADAQGGFNNPQEPNFANWGRTAGDMETGQFSFQTVRPGVVPLADGTKQAPHITFWIVARGINLGLHTRMYFADETQANASDPLLMQVKDKNRLPTLLAQPQGNRVFRFDIRLQGPGETIFLDI